MKMDTNWSMVICSLCEHRKWPSLDVPHWICAECENKRMTTITESAVFSNWEVYTGKRHFDCLKKINIYWKRPADEVQWFMTNKWNFVTREKALSIVLNNDQTLRSNRKGLEKCSILYSEDLY